MSLYLYISNKQVPTAIKIPRTLWSPILKPDPYWDQLFDLPLDLPLDLPFNMPLNLDLAGLFKWQIQSARALKVRSAHRVIINPKEGLRTWLFTVVDCSDFRKW